MITLLNVYYIMIIQKNCYRLIAVDLIRQKEWNAHPKAILQIEFVWQLKNSMLIKIMNLCLF